MSVLNPTTDTRYEPNATDPTVVAAFDTDYTMRYADGPVPLDHVLALREDPDVAVYATGFNQTLRDEAEIPGMVEILDALDNSEMRHVDRPDRMRLLDQLHPEATRRFVVDDVDLRQLEAEGWRYYQPAEYVVQEVGIPLDEWEAELGIHPDDYLASVGDFRGQFHPGDLSITEPAPYDARVADGVGVSRTRGRDDNAVPRREPGRPDDTDTREMWER